MGLAKYFSKRYFDKTPEPKGKPHTKSPSGKLAFVVQEHHASSLHYDFRLEMDGVLKSWAVPKGPSMNPHDRHLAIMTEDHPYEYRTFEGVIPDDHYGAGNVIVWDEGWYEPRAETSGDPQKLLLKELKDGHVTFVLHGTKLQGEFALVKLHGTQAAGNSWLLIKKGDSYASTDDITAQDTSVKTQRSVDELGGKAPSISRYPKKAHPWHVQPMLATLVDEPFSKAGWVFEIKWDGYRAVGSKKGSDIELYSRAGNDFTRKYAPVAEALHSLQHDVVVDGEIVVTGKGGRAHFEWLQNWQADQRGALQYYVFDILWCDGHDVRSMPLKDRKALLAHVIPKHDILHISEDIPENGTALFAEMQKRGMEGMVAKQTDAPYREGARGATWLKVKTSQRQEVVIGGYTEPRGGRKYLGSLLVGVYDADGNFIYTGHSGGGIPDNARRALQQTLQPLERATSPFHTEPTPNAPVHWVTPALVCEMSFGEWTSDGVMRHPQFEGLRSDKRPQDVRREKPHHVPQTAKPPADAPQNTPGLPFEFTHPDKIFFPKHKYTKQDLADYYRSVASYILPYLKDRPCSLLRMPHGITGESFFQKNNGHLPGWVPHANIFSESNNADLHWIVGGKLDTLLYMVQLGCVEINPWNSRVGSLDHPDWLVIDLDPEGVAFSKVIEVAITVHEVCDAWHIPTYPKTSGKTGLHVFIPLHTAYTYEQSKNLAHLIALEVHRRRPDVTSVERMPEKRKRKIYLDFLQNREGQTIAAPYSVRPTADASVSTPLHWDEVRPGLLPSDFTIKNISKRLEKTGDLWKPVLQKGIDIAKVLHTIEQSQGGK